MLKILFVFNHPAPYKVRLLNELAKSYDLTVIFERDENRDRNKEFYSERKYNFKTVPIKGIKLGREGLLSFGVKNHIKHNKYDLIIMNGYSHLSEMIALDYLKKHQIPYVMYINGGIINEKEAKWKKNLKTKYLSGAKYYFSPDENSNKYLKYYGADASKIFNYPYSTIYENEILTKDVELNEKELRNKYNLSESKIFISVGQLIPRKNYLELIKFWNENKIEDTLMIIGEGEEKQKIMDYIEENHLSNVLLPGYLPREEFFKLFRISTAFIFPSKEDIYGHVINEALSQGLPVITTSHVNSGLHLIKNGVNGFIIENINSKNTLEALEFCMNNDMSEACIKTARENTIEKMSEAHIKIIEDNK